MSPDQGDHERSGEGANGRAQQQPQQRRARIAVDLGAESCRVSLLRWRDGVPQIELVHRFANAPCDQPAASHGAAPRLCWNLQAIRAGVEQGLRLAAARAPEGVASIAVDGWAVDYIRLNADGSPLGDPFCYRDPRTLVSEQVVARHLSPEALFARTGAQPLRINTVYQLVADPESGVPVEAPWLLLPEYTLAALGGRRVAEHTNATHTGLVNLATGEWDWELFDLLGLAKSAAPPIVRPGSALGTVTGPLASLPAFHDTQLIAPACHDTASAVSAIPASEAGAAYISSGTWSLVGALTPAAHTSDVACREGFTNLGALDGHFCFHKNVNGMWLLKQCMDRWREQGRAWEITELIAAAESVTAPAGLINVDEPGLLLPGDMPHRVNVELQANHHHPLPESTDAAPEVAALLFRSLAHRYAQVLQSLEEQTGTRVEKIFIVGGGSRNQLLNRLTEQSTGREVVCGAVESSTLGNFAIQLASAEGAYTEQRGVSAERVRYWTGELARAGEPAPATHATATAT